MRDLRRLVEQLGNEAVPLVHQARVVVDHAATEMERVGDVLGSAEAVTVWAATATFSRPKAPVAPTIATFLFFI